MWAQSLSYITALDFMTEKDLRDQLNGCKKAIIQSIIRANLLQLPF